MNYQKIDNIAKHAGGIFFIIKKLTDKTAGVISDPKRRSAVFEFNIGNPLGLHLLFECEKSLADQNIAYMMTDVFWLGEPVTRSGLLYIGSTCDNPARSAPTTQIELIVRINKTIDRWITVLKNNKQVYLNASDRMGFFLNETDFGIFIREKYPQFITPSVPDLRSDKEKQP